MVPNRQLVVYALFLVGGEAKHVHTETIALKCHELFPDAFSWTRYPEYPDKDIVRVALTDARKLTHGALVDGRAGRARGQSAKTQREPARDGWILTPSGVDWVQSNLADLEHVVGARPLKEHRQRVLKQLRRLRTHHLFERYVENPVQFAPSIGEIADLLKCRVDASPTVWGKRFQEVRGLAGSAEQQDFLDFIDHCEGAYVEQR